MDNTTNTAAKPYNRCIKCPHRKERRCDGPRTSAMPFPRWCEFMKLLKEEDGLTNAYIAEKSDMSVKTIERIFSGKYENDIMRDTDRRIEEVIFGTSNQYPCYLAFEEEYPINPDSLNEAMQELERALADNQDYRAAMDAIHASYGTEMQNIRDSYKLELQLQREAHREEVTLLRKDHQEEVAFLRAQLERFQKANDNLRQDITNLWAENNRKSRVIDMFLTKQDVILGKKEE